MKTVSNNELETYQILGRTLRINHSHVAVENTDTMTAKVRIEHTYYTAICDVTDDRNTIIEAIMFSKYTPSQEFATINNMNSKPEAYASYQDFRVLAKSLADGYSYK